MAIYFKDKKSNYLLVNTLASLLGGLVNEYTVIDLRNESSVRGKIIDVDGYMNVELVDCVYLDAQGGMSLFETFFVRGRLIRFVHVPEHLSAKKVIEDFLKKPTKIPQSRNTFKQKRAMKKHETTVKELAFNK